MGDFHQFVSRCKINFYIPPQKNYVLSPLTSKDGYCEDIEGDEPYQCNEAVQCQWTVDISFFTLFTFVMYKNW